MKHHFVVIVFMFFGSLLCAQTYTFNKIVNVTDTIDITAYTDSIPNYVDKTKYIMEYVYDADYYEFLGIDSAKTLIPESGILITNAIEDATENIYKTTLIANNGIATIESINASSNTFLSVMFKPLVSNSGETISSTLLLFPGSDETKADTIEFLYGFTVMAKANFSIQKRICENDTLTIKIFVDSVPNFENKIYCDFTIYYDSMYFEFLQVDSSETIMPNDVLTISDEADNDVNSIKELFLETDGLLTPLFEYDSNASTIFSVQFKMLQPATEAFIFGAFCFYPSESAPGSTGLDCFSYSSYMQIDTVPDVGIEIENNYSNTVLIKTAPQNYTSYNWEYLGETYSSSEISFIEEGLCSVVVTDDNGCKASDSRLVDISGKYFVPGELELCIGDTLSIPVYTDSIAYYGYVNSYSFEYSYAVDSFDFIGVDSSHTIIPEKGLNISYYNSEPGVKVVKVAANSAEHAFYDIDKEADSLITLMFVAKKGFDGNNLIDLLVETNLESGQENLYSLQNRINVYDNQIEICELEKTKDYLSVFATSGYKDYVWSYEVTSSSDYAFDSFSSSDSSAYFIGNGSYYVWATDEHGCKLTAEKHVENSGVFAKGIVTADQELYSDGMVAAYLKTENTYNLFAQASITEGTYLFPGTLSSGYYVFCAIPNQDDNYQATYYSNCAYLEDAQVINLSDNDGVVSLDINLLPKNTTGTKYYSKKNAIEIYPNPVRDYLYLHFYSFNESKSKAPILIVDALGRIVIQKEILFPSGSDQLSIDVSSLSNGFYYIVIGENSIKFLKS